MGFIDLFSTATVLGDHQVKVISWNVNGLRSVAQKGFWEFLESSGADFVCLQETKCHPDQLEDALAFPLGWKTFWSSAAKPGYSGTVIYARESPLNMQTGFGIPKFDAEGRMVVLEYPAFTLFNVYFPNGASGEVRHKFKQEFLRKFGRHLCGLKAQGRSLIVVGDYNVAYLDHDVFDPNEVKGESGFLPEERQWMRSFLEQGFVDSFRALHPEAANKFTWWAYYENARFSNRGWRIDHICISEDLRPKLKVAEILDEQMGSDHCPVMIELTL